MALIIEEKKVPSVTDQLITYQQIGVDFSAGGLHIETVPKQPCPICCGMECCCNSTDHGDQVVTCHACTKNVDSTTLINGMELCPDSVEKTKYSILDALKDLETSKKVLMLVRLSDGESYVVKSHDPETKITVLQGSHGKSVRVKLTNKEYLLYKPVFR